MPSAQRILCIVLAPTPLERSLDWDLRGFLLDMTPFSEMLDWESQVPTELISRSWGILTTLYMRISFGVPSMGQNNFAMAHPSRATRAIATPSSSAPNETSRLCRKLPMLHNSAGRRICTPFPKPTNTIALFDLKIAFPGQPSRAGQSRTGAVWASVLSLPSMTRGQ